MESTFCLNRANKRICWFTIAISIGAIVWIVSRCIRLMHRYVINSSPDKQMLIIFLLFFSLAMIILFAVMIVMIWKILKHSVKLSDEAVQVGNRTIAWSDIKNIYHPARTFGLGFRMMLYDGTSVEVYPVKDLHQLENAINKKINNSQGGDDRAEIQPAVEYMLGCKWCVYLVFGQLLTAIGLTAALIGFFAHLAGPSGFSVNVKKIADAIPIVVFPFAFILLNAFMNWIKRLSAFKVVIFDHVICIGDMTVKWDEITGIEHPRNAIGVEFRVKTRDGKRFNIYSGIKNVDNIENIIRDKLNGGSGGNTRHLSPST